MQLILYINRVNNFNRMQIRAVKNEMKLPLFAITQSTLQLKNIKDYGDRRQMKIAAYCNSNFN